MPPKPADRRSFTRIPFRTAVRIDAGGKIIRADGEFDISMGGIRVPYAGSLPDGTRCRITVVLQEAPAEVAIRAAGRITRTDEANLAVEFTELDPDSYSHLRKLILSNIKDPEKAEQEFQSHWGIKRPQ
jgi:hypothetical protein